MYRWDRLLWQKTPESCPSARLRHRSGFVFGCNGVCYSQGCEFAAYYHFLSFSALTFLFYLFSTLLVAVLGVIFAIIRSQNNPVQNIPSSYQVSWNRLISGRGESCWELRTPMPIIGIKTSPTLLCQIVHCGKLPHKCISIKMRGSFFAF